VGGQGKKGRQPRPQAEADQSHQQRLEQNHAHEHPVGGPHGLEHAEVAEIVQGEIVEDLAGDRRTHHEAHDDHEAEVDEHPGVLEHEIQGLLLELAGRQGRQFRSLGDAFGHGLGRFPGFGLDQDEREHLAVARIEVLGLGVGRIKDGIGPEGGRGPGDAHHRGALFVDLQGVAHAQGTRRLARDGRALGEPVACAVFVHDDGIGHAQVRQLAFDDLARTADQGGVVEAEDGGVFQLAVGQSDALASLVQGHGPQHALDAAHPIELGVEQGPGFVRRAHHGVHDPDVGQADVGDEAVGVRKHGEKDARLLDHEDRGQGDAGNDAEIFPLVAKEHGDGDAKHMWCCCRRVFCAVRRRT